MVLFKYIILYYIFFLFEGIIGYDDMFHAGSMKTYFLTLFSNGTENNKTWEFSLHVAES